MKRQLSVVRSESTLGIESYRRTDGQLSAKKLFMSFPTLIGKPAILLILFLTLNFSLSTSFAVDKGKLVIPKREDNSIRNRDDSPGIESNRPDVTAVVERIQKTFAGINDIKGTFLQNSFIKDIEQRQEYSGTFFIKKPSRMMWEYAEPRDEKVVINDTDTWIYKKSQNQVIKTKFSKGAYSQVPIALLGSLEKLIADFDITMPEENALQLIPKRKTGFMKTLILETTSGYFPIKMFTIFDTYGNIIMIDLNNIETNSGLDDSLFIFKIPPGAEVFDMSQ